MRPRGTPQQLYERRREAVRQVIERKRPQAEVARAIGVHPATLCGADKGVILIFRPTAATASYLSGAGLHEMFLSPLQQQKQNETPARRRGASAAAPRMASGKAGSGTGVGPARPALAPKLAAIRLKSVRFTSPSPLKSPCCQLPAD